MSKVHGVARWALVAGVVASTAVASASPPTRSERVNAAGQAVRHADGSPRNYARHELLAAAPLPARAAPPAAAQPRTVPEARANWGWAALGAGIGMTGLVTAVNDGQTELYASSFTGTFGNTGDYWYALRWNGAQQQFDPFFVSDRPSAGIRQILVVTTATARSRDSRRHIVVALADGQLRRYDLRTKRQLSTTAGPCVTRNGLKALTAADFNADGIEELVSICGDDTLFVNQENGASWSLAGVGGTRLVVGQMDNDPALEIVSTSGRVVDHATRSVQWYRPEGFGVHLQAGDIDGDGRDELISGEAWYWVWSYDVERQLPKWSLRADLDVAALLLADVDGDGVKDLLVGDGQWGQVRAYDAATTAPKGSMPNPEHGVTQIAVVPLPGSNLPRLLWGAGATSSGADHLYVANWQTKTLIWQNEDLVGPFLGPEVGDLDGDGVAEIVFASFRSDAGYDSGRIVVLDSQTLAVRAISPGVAGVMFGWTGLHDLKLRDLDGDGRAEILVGTDWLYDGVIEAYKFTAGNQFSLFWSNATRPSGSPFQAVELADVDGDGTLEVLGGVGTAHSGSQGNYIYAYDLATGAQKWRTLHLGGSVVGLRVGDFNGNGVPDFAASVRGGNTFVFSGPGQVLDAIIPGPASFLGMVQPGAIPQLLIGQTDGRISLRQFDGGLAYPETWSLTAGTGAIDGVATAPGGQWWVGTEGRLLRYDGTGVNFQTAVYGTGMGRRAAVLGTPGRVFSAGAYGIFRFDLP